MKVLNLYSGIGGNRKLWNGVDVTAVEINKEIADIYQEFFPNDEVIVGDAHDFLLQHFNEYDFIWSSPPCQTHSQIRYNLGVKNRPTKPVYPDMTLYQEILFLRYYFKRKWVVENTVAFYKPLVAAQSCGRHWFWSNFAICDLPVHTREHRSGTVKTLQQLKGINLDKFDIHNKRQILRNCTEPELGKHIFDCAFKLQQKKIDKDNERIIKNLKGLDKKFKQIDESIRKSLMVSEETMHKRFS